MNLQFNFRFKGTVKFKVEVMVKFKVEATVKFKVEVTAKFKSEVTHLFDDRSDHGPEAPQTQLRAPRVLNLRRGFIVSIV